jgi:PAS domain S-box-containing protein
MSVVARVRIPADAFGFGDSLETIPGTDVEVLRLVPDDATVVLYLQVDADDSDRFEADLRDDPRVIDLTPHDRRAETTLYHVEWNAASDCLLALLRDHGVSVEHGVRADGDWTFRLRVSDRDALRTVRAACRKHDLPLRTVRVVDETRASATDDGGADRPTAATRERRSPTASGRPDPFREIVENLAEVVWMTDPEKAEMLYVNPAYEEVWGRPRERLYEEPLAFLDPIHPDDRERVRAALDAQAEGSYDEEYRIERPDGSRRWIHDRAVPIRDADGDVYRVAGIAEDITRGKRRERFLTAINEVTRDLLTVESRDRVADLVVRTVHDVLELPLVSVYRFDGDAGALRPVAWSSDVDEVLGDLPTFSGAGSLAWDAFVDGDTRVYADVRTQDRVYDPETPVRSELIVPIGDHGVVLAGNRATDAFDEVDVEFVELLAASAKAALDRVAYERDLERQNERLAELSRLNTVIRSINRAVVSASTRERIVSAVCEQLVANGPYVAAWIGEYRADGVLEVHATAGSAEAAFDRTRIPVDEADPLDELVGTAVRARAVHVIQDLERTATDAWHERIVERGGRGVAAIPLTAGEALYGVLALYTDRDDVFDEVETTVLRELGQTIGRAIRAAELRRAVTAETAIEVEIRLTGRGSWFVATSEALDCRFDLDGLVPLDDGTLLAYVTATDTDPDAIADRATGSDAVELRRVIDETDGDVLFELRLTGLSAIRPLLDYSATIRSAVADRGRGHLTVELPPATDVRTVLDGLRNVCPSAELAARRELDRPVETVEQFRGTLTERLTEKQRNALRTAYFAGYFAWPRRSTAEEVADSMGISSATLHFHLRHALKEMLVALFEQERDG